LNLKKHCLIEIFIIILLCSIIPDNAKAFSLAVNKPCNTVIVIDTDEKRLYVLSDGKIIRKFPVATGKRNTPSPLGDFRVNNKEKWGEGFGTSWIGLDVPWGKFGIHGTNKPGSIGYSASGGCIRMRNKDVDELYKMVNIGTPVKIVGGYYDMMGYGFRIINQGDRGSDVQIVQKKLKEQGYYNGNLDGVYGAGMESAVKRFEKSKGLSVSPNIGQSFYKALGLTLYE
jgi:hypothetical protein